MTKGFSGEQSRRQTRSPTRIFRISLVFVVSAFELVFKPRSVREPVSDIPTPKPPTHLHRRIARPWLLHRQGASGCIRQCPRSTRLPAEELSCVCLEKLYHPQPPHAPQHTHYLKSFFNPIATSNESAPHATASLSAVWTVIVIGLPDTLTTKHAVLIRRDPFPRWRPFATTHPLTPSHPLPATLGTDRAEI